MKIYTFEIPKHSAKRFEFSRKFLVRLNGFVDPDTCVEGYKLRAGVTHIMWEGPDELEHHDHDLLDADYHYSFSFEFSNSTGSRKEQVKVKPDDGIKLHESANWQLLPSREG